MVKDLDDFIDLLDYFLLEYKHDLPINYLKNHGLNSTSEIAIIIENAIEGKKENGLDRLKNVRDYLIECLKYYKSVYGYDDEFESQEELESIFSELINDLEPKNFAEMVELITPEQIMNIKSLSRQKNIPEDIERELSSYVAITPKGGNRKKYKTKSKTRKNKNKNKRVKKTTSKRSKKNKKYYK